MDAKTKGIMKAVIVAVVLVFLSVIAGSVTAIFSRNPWNGLIVAIIVLIVSGLAMVGLLVMGIIRYKKHDSRFGLGLFYGSLGVFLFLLSMAVFIMLYDMIFMSWFLY